MTRINPIAAEKIQFELFSDKTFHWAGVPNRRVIFHSDDWLMIPFSVLWALFAVDWEAGALGWAGQQKSGDPFFVLWGIPFLVIGNYMVWGRFLHDAWLKRRTYYAITNRRALILQEGWTRKVVSAFPNELLIIEREGTLTGTLWLGPQYPLIGARGVECGQQVGSICMTCRYSPTSVMWIKVIIY